MTNSTKKPATGTICLLVFALLVLAPLFLLGLYAMYRLYLIPPFSGDYDLANAGQFGDSFGILTCLFSGGAFFGVLFTLHLQRKEMKRNEEIHQATLLLEREKTRLAEEERRKSDVERRKEKQRSEAIHHKSIRMAALSALMSVSSNTPIDKEMRDKAREELVRIVGFNVVDE